MACEIDKCISSLFLCVGMCEDRHHSHCSEIYCTSNEICDIVEYKCKKHCTEMSHDHCSKPNCTKSAEYALCDGLCSTHCVKVDCARHCSKILCSSENICDLENSFCIYHCEKAENHNVQNHCRYKYCMNLSFKNNFCIKHNK